MPEILNRVLRAVKLEPEVYRELEADESKTGEAILVAGAAFLIGAIPTLGGTNVFNWIIGAAFSATVGMGIWTGIVWLLGRMFGGDARYGGLFRGMGYAASPFAIGIIPNIGGFVGLVWAVVCSVIVVREAHRISTGAAVATVIIPVALIVVLVILLIALVSLTLIGIFA